MSRPMFPPAMVLVAAVLAVAAPASAQQATTGTGQRLSEWDHNRDGALALDEFAAEARTAFDAVDDDRNGNISAAELEDAAPQSEAGLSAAHRIGLVDANDDGTLALDEYEDDVEAHFEALDADDSGGLELAELEAGWTGRLPRP